MRVERLTKHLWLVVAGDGYSEAVAGKEAALARAEELEPGARCQVLDDTGIPEVARQGSGATATIDETERALFAGAQALKLPDLTTRGRLIAVYGAMRAITRGKALRISKKRQLKPRI